MSRRSLAAAADFGWGRFREYDEIGRATSLTKQFALFLPPPLSLVADKAPSLRCPLTLISRILSDFPGQMPAVCIPRESYWLQICSSLRVLLSAQFIRTSETQSCS